MKNTFGFSLCTVALLLFPSTGCRVVEKAADAPGEAFQAMTGGGKSKNQATEPVVLQQTLLRFADEYSTRMILSVDKLQRGGKPLDPAEVLKWKIALATETCFIASGPSPIANLLDMTILVSVTQMALEEHWQPKVFGESASMMVETSRNGETNIWALVGAVLTAEQQKSLHAAIEEWHRQNPSPENVLAARALRITSQMAEANKKNPKQFGNVFSLLNLDPLAGIDPAVREITQTRLFAERALYVSQKMPMLLRWQTELLTVNAMEMQGVRQLITNSTQIAAAVDRASAVAEKLPGIVSAEREEIVKALESQEKNLLPVMNEARATLTAGSQMSTSLNITLTTFDALMKRFGVGETNNAAPASTNAEPFRIQDYGQVAVQLEGTARQLTELLLTLDRTLGSTNLQQLSAQVSPAVQRAETGGKEIVDYAFWKGVLFAVVVLIAGLIYKLLSSRLLKKYA